MKALINVNHNMKLDFTNVKKILVDKEEASVIHEKYKEGTVPMFERMAQNLRQF
ncbi:MAG: hypothetical protein ACLTH3_06745 [Lachnospira sp.]